MPSIPKSQTHSLLFRLFFLLALSELQHCILADFQPGLLSPRMHSSCMYFYLGILLFSSGPYTPTCHQDCLVWHLFCSGFRNFSQILLWHLHLGYIHLLVCHNSNVLRAHKVLLRMPLLSLLFVDTTDESAHVRISRFFGEWSARQTSESPLHSYLCHRRYKMWMIRIYSLHPSPWIKWERWPAHCHPPVII